MFLIDDFLLRSLGVTMPAGLDMIETMTEIKNFAYREMYDPEEIKSLIKENRLLYEFGELSREEYEQKNTELMHDLKFAETVQR